jgi:hypothetical protein
MATNPLPVDLERIVLVRDEEGVVQRRGEDEATTADTFHAHYIIARATAVRSPCRASNRATGCAARATCLCRGLLHLVLPATERRSVWRAAVLRQEGRQPADAASQQLQVPPRHLLGDLA